MARDTNKPDKPHEQLPRVIDPSFHLPSPPFWLIAGLLVLVVASWVPLSLIMLSRVTLSERRPIALAQDMGDQPRYNAQSVNRLFQDNRSMRPPVPGTVARGELREDDHYYRGYQLVQNDEGEWQPEYFEGLPPQVEVNEGLMQRGRERFDIYCYPCHGYDGQGNGPINQRATELMAAGPRGAGTVWTSAANLHARGEDGQATYGPEAYADGRLFSVITHGISNMPAYGSQIETADRWAIVAYVRALQISQADQPSEDTDQTADATDQPSNPATTEP